MQDLCKDSTWFQNQKNVEGNSSKPTSNSALGNLTACLFNLFIVRLVAANSVFRRSVQSNLNSISFVEVFEMPCSAHPHCALYLYQLIGQDGDAVIVFGFSHSIVTGLLLLPSFTINGCIALFKRFRRADKFISFRVLGDMVAAFRH